MTTRFGRSHEEILEEELQDAYNHFVLILRNLHSAALSSPPLSNLTIADLINQQIQRMMAAAQEHAQEHVANQ